MQNYRMHRHSRHLAPVMRLRSPFTPNLGEGRNREECGIECCRGMRPCRFALCVCWSLAFDFAMSSPSFAKRIRGSFSRESMPSAPNGVSHPMLHLDFGHERSAPPTTRELPAVTRLKKQDKRDSKLKNRVSVLVRSVYYDITDL